MICNFEGIRSIISAGFSGFIFLCKFLNISLTAGFRASTLDKMCPRWSTIKKEMAHFGTVFVRKNPLAPGLILFTSDDKLIFICKGIKGEQKILIIQFQ